MRDNSRLLKLFFLLFICSVYVFSFSHFGALAYTAFNSQDGPFLSGTMAASIKLEGKTETEALTAINTKKLEWLQHSEIILRYKEKSLKLNLKMFEFFPEQTISSLNIGQNNPIRVSLNQRLLEKDLDSFSSNFQIAGNDLNNLSYKLINLASLLQIGKFDINMEDSVHTNADNSETVINESIMKPKNGIVELKQLAMELTPINISPQSSFSLLDYCQKKGLVNIPSKTLSMIASGIYQSILSTNFSLQERNTGRELPDFVDLGYEAKVDQTNNLDFVFTNPNADPYVLKFIWKKDGMHIQLQGKKFIYSYVAVKEDEQHFSPKTVKQFSPLLPLGKSKITETGKDGLLVNVYRELFDSNNLVKKELIAEDFYPPVNRIEIDSLQVPKSQQDSTGEMGTSNGLSSSLTNNGDGTSVGPNTPNNVIPNPSTTNQQQSTLSDLSKIQTNPISTRK
ncbi:MAG: G5 domain-containing protein [Bacillota bacterium]|nr:G5 domain-containing protein [Bacillota bacterium]